jgi:hypothetical protein
MFVLSLAYIMLYILFVCTSCHILSFIGNAIKSCNSLVFILLNYTEMHGTKNIKFVSSVTR